MRALVVIAAVLCLTPAADAARKGRAAAAEPPPDPAGRVALLEAKPTARVGRKLARELTEVAERKMKDAGIDLVTAKEVAQAYRKKRRKVPDCGDDAQCLLEAGQLARAAYAVSISFTAAGRNLGLKMTVVETDTAKVVSNILSFVARPTRKALTAALENQIERTVPAVKGDIEEKRALAAAKKAEEERIAAEKAAAEQAEMERLAAEEEARIQAEQERLARLQAEERQRIAAELARRQPREKAVVEYEKRFRPMPLVVVGAGAVTTGVGIGVFGLQAQRALDDFKAGRNPEEAAARARSRALVADFTAGAGIAAMVGGVLWWVLGDDPGESPIALSPSFNGVAVSGSF